MVLGHSPDDISTRNVELAITELRLNIQHLQSQPYLKHRGQWVNGLPGHHWGGWTWESCFTDWYDNAVNLIKTKHNRLPIRRHVRKSLLTNMGFTLNFFRAIQDRKKLDWTRTTRTPAFWGYTPAASWLLILLSHIRSKEDKVKVTNSKNSPKFQILKQTLHATHLKLLDKMCKCEMDPMSIVEDTERTRFCPQTDRRTVGQGETSIPPLSTSLKRAGYN